MHARFLHLVVACSIPAAAQAADDRGAGLYGLLEADFSLVAGVGGGGYGSSAGSGAAGAVEARIRYLSSASLVVGWDVRPEHALVAAAEIRPLFLILFFENRFTGDDLVDFVLYGLGVTGGVSASAQGLSFLTGIGTEWPLARRGGGGLFARTEMRGRFAHSTWPNGADDAVELQGLLLLQWHAPFELALVR